MSNKQLEDINKLLEAMLSIQLSNMQPEVSEKRLGEKIKRLVHLNLSSSTIARILGTTTGYVSKEMSLIKSRSRNGNKK